MASLFSKLTLFKSKTTNTTSYLFPSLLVTLFIVIPLSTLLFLASAWIESAPLPNAKAPIELYDTYQGVNVEAVLLHAMKSAKESILISVFGLDSQRILELLNKRSQEIDVYLFLEKSRPLVEPLDEKVKQIYIHKNSLMHHKLCIIDQSIVFLGSCNFTSSSFYKDFNMMIGIFDPIIAKEMSHSLLMKAEKTKWLNSYKITTNREIHFEFFFLCSKDKKIQNQARNLLIDALKNAKESIRIALFVWTDQELVDLVIDKHLEGVKVEVILDRYHPSKKTIERLKKMRVPLFISNGKRVMHHKFAWIDKTTFISGSVNWTKNGFYKNDEILSKLEPLTEKENLKLKALWNTLLQFSCPIAQKDLG